MSFVARTSTLRCSATRESSPEATARLLLWQAEQTTETATNRMLENEGGSWAGGVGEGSGEGGKPVRPPVCQGLIDVLRLLRLLKLLKLWPRLTFRGRGL